MASRPQPNTMRDPMTVLTIIIMAAGLSATLILALRPLLLRYALARPNARSSHRIPTPQGGGIAVVGAALFVAAVGYALAKISAPQGLPWIVAATVVLALVGAVDDIRPLPAALRLILQILAVAAVVIAVGGGRVLPEAVPSWLERGILILAGVWFVNLVNFMDGLDWMTVAEMVPITAALTMFGLGGVMGGGETVMAAALLGALLGFAPFNKPVARLFLGDVGSLPIGLLVGWLLYRLALEGGLAAALLLPLYYLADATLTLLRRLAGGERVWEAHRSHFYQRATDNGFTVLSVATHVAALNGALALLSALTLVADAWPVDLAALTVGGTLVAVTLRRFSTPRLARAVA